MAIAELDGYVTDPSGQAIAGADVKATNVDKGQVHNTVSDSSGRYALPDLPVGNYRLEVAAKGFKTYVQTGIILQVATQRYRQCPDAARRGDRECPSGSQCQPWWRPRKTPWRRSLTSRAWSICRLNGRNPTQLLTLTGAGTSTMNLNSSDLTGSKNMQGSNGSGQFSVAGCASQRHQLPVGRRRQQRLVQQRESADPVPGRHPGIQRADQRPAGAVRIASRRRGQHRHQVGIECVPRRPVRVFAQRRSQRPAGGRRKHATGARQLEAQPVRRNRRAAESSRTSCSSSAGIRARGSAATPPRELPTFPPRQCSMGTSAWLMAPSRAAAA